MKKTILIVEDDDEVRDFAAATLETVGYVVLRASNASMGQQFFEAKRPALVLLDIGLPGVDGLVALRRMSSYALLQAQPTKFVMMTAHHTKQDVEQAIRNGAHDYLVKPITQYTLVRKVRKHIG